MASEWKKAPLSELTEPDTPVTYGVVKPGEEDPQGVLFIRGGDIANGRILTNQLRTISKEISSQYKRTLLRGGEILMSLVGNPGQVAIVPESLRGANIARQAALIRLRPDVDSPFVMYFLGSRIGQEALGAHSRGSVQQVINLRDLKTVEVPKPPLSEQRAIAYILGTLDDKIELNRRMSETLEAMARALFKSWFVDFDPVRAKAEGRDPGLPDAIADLFPTALTEHPDLGEIPEGWSIGPILDRARLLSGGTPKTARQDYWGGQIAWATAKDVSQSSGSFLVDTERAITEQGLNESATQIVPALSSVVVARGATTGRMVLLGCDMAMNQTCYALTTTTETPFALYCQLRNEIGALVHAAHGSVFDTITTRTIASARVVLPPELVLRTFEDQVAALLRRVLECTRESRSLTALRDALLPKLISGDLRFDDPKRILERVG